MSQPCLGEEQEVAVNQLNQLQTLRCGCAGTELWGFACFCTRRIPDQVFVTKQVDSSNPAQQRTHGLINTCNPM